MFVFGSNTATADVPQRALLPALTIEERRRLRNAGLCMRCRKSGHYVSDCTANIEIVPGSVPIRTYLVSDDNTSTNPIKTPVKEIVPCKDFHVSCFFTRADLSDITLKFGTRQLKGHKVVLASGSEYFKKLFYGSFAEHDQEEVVLKEDDDESALEFMMAWIYYAKRELELGEWVSEDDFTLRDRIRERFNLFAAADKYCVTSLADKVAITLEEETRPWGMTVDEKSPGLGGITVYMDELYSPREVGLPDRLHAIIKPVMKKRLLSLLEEAQFCQLFTKYPEFAETFLIEHPSILQEIAKKGGTIPEEVTQILKEVDGLALRLLKLLAEEQKSNCCNHLLATLLADEDFCQLIEDKTDLAIAMLKDVPAKQGVSGPKFGFSGFGSG